MGSPHTFFRVCLALVFSFFVGFAPQSARAVDPVHKLILPESPLFRVEIGDPVALVNHQLVQQFWTQLQKSQQFQMSLDSAEFETLVEVQTLFESHLKTDWRSGISQLFNGGMSITASTIGKDRFSAVVTAANAETIEKYLAFAKELARLEALKKNAELELKSKEYRGVTSYQLDQLFYAHLENRLLFTNNGDELKKIIDRLKELPSDASQPAKKTASPIVRVEVDLAQVWKENDLPMFPVQPDQTGLALNFGGYLDLLHRGSKIVGEVELTKTTIKLHAEIDAGTKGMPVGIKGYFASKPGAQAAPLLDVPGTIYSGSWYRDFGDIWQNRKALLNEDAVKALEKGNEDLKTQLTTIGLRELPSQIAEQMGSHQRVIIARQLEIPYNVKLENKFPAGAFLIDLKNEDKFREYAAPVLRTINLFVTGAQQGQAVIKAVDYKDAQLQVMSFYDDANNLKKGNQVRYNFSPTFAITRNHLILSSTQQLVEQIIDQLDKEQKHPQSQPTNEHVTEQTLLSLETVGKTLLDFHETLVRTIVFENGLSVDEAEKELGIFRDLIGLAKQLRQKTRFSEQKFETEFELGIPAP